MQVEPQLADPLSTSLQPGNHCELVPAVMSIPGGSVAIATIQPRRGRKKIQQLINN
jgi:hypothetical protein